MVKISTNKKQIKYIIYNEINMIEIEKFIPKCISLMKTNFLVMKKNLCNWGEQIKLYDIL